jgi:hypothetical protein
MWVYGAGGGSLRARLPGSGCAAFGVGGLITAAECLGAAGSAP